jgi:hypothetical protein
VVAGGDGLKSFETLRTWLIIGGLLLFSGLASLAWVSFSGQGGIAGLDLTGQGLNLDLSVDVGEPVTIQLDQYLLGEVLVDAPLIGNLQGMQVHPLVLAAILTAVMVGGLVAVGLPLALIYVRLDRQAEQVKEDDAFQESRAALEKKQTERLRARNEAQPATPMPSHQMPRWAAVSTTLVVLFFVVLVGYVLADTFFPGGDVELANSLFISPAIILSVVLGLITVLAMVPRFSRNTAEEEGQDAGESRVPWGAIWVALTGFIFLGLGTGLMLAIRSAGG